MNLKEANIYNNLGISSELEKEPDSISKYNINKGLNEVSYESNNITNNIDKNINVYNESYRRNQIYILKCFAQIIKNNNELYIEYISNDKMNLNYNKIESFDDICISLLMLQVYYFMTGFNPIIQSIDEIINNISSLNIENSSLQDTIQIRNYYSEIINIFIDIEYLSPNATTFILDYYSVSIINKFGLIYDLKKWCEINYHLLLFIYENLNIIQFEKNIYIDDNDSINFAIITTIYNFLNTTNFIDLNIYNELSDNKKKLEIKDSFSSEEEKKNIENCINTVDSFKYLSIFLIKYCNILMKKICNNKLTYSDNGLLFDFNIIINTLNDYDNLDLLNTFQNLQINLSNTNEIQSVLKNLLSLDKFDEYSVVIENFQKEVKILENSENSENTENLKLQINSNLENKVIGAGITLKNKKNKIRNKTRNKIINKTKNSKNRNKKNTQKKINSKKRKYTKKR
jgi:hypothetical protein